MISVAQTGLRFLSGLQLSRLLTRPTKRCRKVHEWPERKSTRQDHKEEMANYTGSMLGEGKVGVDEQFRNSFSRACGPGGTLHLFELEGEGAFTIMRATFGDFKVGKDGMIMEWWESKKKGSLDSLPRVEALLPFGAGSKFPACPCFI